MIMHSCSSELIKSGNKVLFVWRRKMIQVPITIVLILIHAYTSACGVELIWPRMSGLIYIYII